MASRKPPKPPEDGENAAPERDDRTASMFGDDSPAQAGGAYQVLARKYRPATFEDLAGQETMVRTLTNAFRTGRIAHAFMLTGVRGVGKTTTARLLARALNYKSDKLDAPSITLTPKGVHCDAIMASTHPDVLELDAASHTKVEEMRDLLDGSRYAPVSARYKVYIIDEVHMLSNHSFNALLKTLEEPPPHVKFIFATTEIRKVPVTVLSRCQRFNLQRFSNEALADHLAGICAKEGASVSPEALALIARAAEGSARDALSILDQAISQFSILHTLDGSELQTLQGERISTLQGVSAEQVRDMLGLADRSRVFDLMEAIIAAAHGDALKEASGLLAAGADAQVLVKDLLDVMTEVSRAQALKDAYAYAGPADWAKRTKAIAARLSPAQAARMWRMMLQGFEDCARAPDPSMAAQMVVLRLAAVTALPPPEDGARLIAAVRDGAAHPPRDMGEPVREPRGGDNGGKGASAIAEGATLRAPLPAMEEEPAGPRMASLREVLAELMAQRRIDLKYEIERFVRPAEIDFGHFHYTAAPGAPVDLSLRIRTWLEETSGVEWDVMQSGGGANAETQVERRARRRREKLAEAESHPRVAEALRLFPGARVVRVDEEGADDEFDDIGEDETAANVIHVDFGARGRSAGDAGNIAADEMLPEYAAEQMPDDMTEPWSEPWEDDD